jgi:hypothetical protein
MSRFIISIVAVLLAISAPGNATIAFAKPLPCTQHEKSTAFMLLNVEGLSMRLRSIM